MINLEQLTMLSAFVARVHNTIFGRHVYKRWLTVSAKLATTGVELWESI